MRKSRPSVSMILATVLLATSGSGGRTQEILSLLALSPFLFHGLGEGGEGGAGPAGLTLIGSAFSKHASASGVIAYGHVSSRVGPFSFCGAYRSYWWVRLLPTFSIGASGMHAGG